MRARVAPHYTVVRFVCNETRGPDLLFLVSIRAQPGGLSGTPQRHSALIWMASREAKQARAIFVSMRARPGGSVAWSAGRRVPRRKARQGTARGPGPGRGPA